MEVKKPEIIEKVWGKEEIFTDGTEPYCGKKLHLNEGYRCSIHKHPKEESFYIEKGEIYFELENNVGEIEKNILFPTDIVHLLPNKYHRFSGLKDSIIIEISTPDTESERKTQSELIPDFENWKKKILNNEKELNEISNNS